MVQGSDTSAVLVVSGLVEGTYNFTLTVVNKNTLSASDMATVSVAPHPMQLYMLQVVLEENNTFSLADQVKIDI